RGGLRGRAGHGQGALGPVCRREDAGRGHRGRAGRTATPAPRGLDPAVSVGGNAGGGPRGEAPGPGPPPVRQPDGGAGGPQGRVPLLHSGRPPAPARRAGPALPPVFHTPRPRRPPAQPTPPLPARPPPTP